MTGLLEFNNVAGYSGVKEALDTSGSVSCRSTGINSTQWQKEEHGESASRAVLWRGHRKVRMRVLGVVFFPTSSPRRGW